MKLETMWVTSSLSEDEGVPPDLSPEDLQQVDVKAGLEEIERLLSMGVIREPTENELEHGDPLSTRSVYDWRFRENCWKCRCRFVAREFKVVTVVVLQRLPPHLALVAS